MSDDPSPSRSAAPAGDPTNLDHDGGGAPTLGDSNHGDTHEGDQRRGRRRRRPRNRKKRNPGLKKKLEFVTHLLRGLDSLVFAEMSALYYMEYGTHKSFQRVPRDGKTDHRSSRCSMFRFIIRAIGQLMYLSPKDESFPFLMQASRSQVALIVFPNLWCMLVHLFAALPRGPDYHRGYQHGGLVIDFVGQKPPAYRIYYLLADVLLLGLQCLMLAIHVEREKLRLSLKTFRPLAVDTALEVATARTIDDLDAEEQNIRSLGPSVADASGQDDGIELQPLRRSSSRRRRRYTSDSDSQASLEDDDISRSRLSDILTSGNALLGEYHVLHCMRVATTELERTTALSLQSIGYRATMAALDARRRGVTVQARADRGEQ